MLKGLYGTDLAASRAAYTTLRHGFYAESCLHMIGDGLRRGELRTLKNGPMSGHD